MTDLSNVAQAAAELGETVSTIGKYADKAADLAKTHPVGAAVAAAAVVGMAGYGLWNAGKALAGWRSGKK